MTPKPYHCRHLFTDGHQCGSPALRGEPLCFYHHAAPPSSAPSPATPASPSPSPPTPRRPAGPRRAPPPHRHRRRRRPAVRNLLRILANAGANLARIERQTAAALKAAQREAQRQTRRNRRPPTYRQAFDELEAKQQADPTQPEIQAEVQLQPQPNQDFGLLQKLPQPTHEPHTELACA